MVIYPEYMHTERKYFYFLKYFWSFNSLEKDKVAAKLVIATQQQSRLDVLAEFEKVIARLEVITGGKVAGH